MKSMGTGWVHGLSGLGERLHLDIWWLRCWPTEMKFYLFFHRKLFLLTKLWEEHTSQVYVSDSSIAHVLRNVHWTWFHLLFLWFQNPVQQKKNHDQKCFLWSITQLIRQEKRNFCPHVNVQIVMVARLQERQPDPNLYWPDHLSQIRAKMYLCILQLWPAFSKSPDTI